MMQRKKNSGNGGATHFNVGADDDGGSAKRKPSHLPFAPRLKAAFGPSLLGTRKRSYSKRAPSDASSPPGFCLPEIPIVIKLILLSFVGFAFLVVLTAKGRHAHWRYQNVMRGPHMPEPIALALRRGEKGSRSAASRSVKIDEDVERIRKINEDGDGMPPSEDATERMLAHPSRFVDSEKKLKRQLLKLLERQNAEKKKKPRDANDSVLGIKIANRYLGEDILPYPESKGVEKKWEKEMDKRKSELSREDEKDWLGIMQQYDEAMDNLVRGGDVDGPNLHAQQSKGEPEGGETASDPQSIRPPKGTDRWPSPSEKAGPGTTILLGPAFGAHRPSKDAILVFAEGYDLSIYLAFVESLASTGYAGDLVLSISNEERLKPGVKDYLQSKNAQSGGLNVVAYEVNWSCFKQTGEAASGSNEGINHCRMNDAFGNASGSPVPDPREPRPVATARYELYWIWSLRYDRESWLMLIDARDVWFQLHPFRELTDRGKVSGKLHLFAENAEAVKIGTSNYNRNWLKTAYGEKAVSPYFDQPVICSGSTIGNQDAIETYLRAMVSEYDATFCKLKGCDQGFHNYLYYSGKLGAADGDGGVEGISEVIVHEQGKGIINNLAALRTKPLKEWGLYSPERQVVLNWDGSISAVAHQYDRDKEVNIMVKGKKRQFDQRWKSSNK